ncbi:MAG: 50S ribosomal protein L20 [Candidatus Andersenbacteria bacterium]
MPRAVRSIAKHRRHKKWLKRAKGFRGRRKSVFKLAKEAVLKAGQHAYYDRRKKKSAFRQLWHVRINAAARAHGVTYSQLLHGLKLYHSELDRKVLAQIAAEHPEIFKEIVMIATAKLPIKKTPAA